MRHFLRILTNSFVFLYASYALSTFSPYQASYNLYNMLSEQRLSSKEIDIYIGTILSNLHQQPTTNIFSGIPLTSKSDFLKNEALLVDSLTGLYSNKNLREFQSYNSIESFLRASEQTFKSLYPAISLLTPSEVKAVQAMYGELIENIQVLQARSGKKLGEKWQELAHYVQEYEQALDKQEKAYTNEIIRQTQGVGLIPDIWVSLIDMLDYLSIQSMHTPPNNPPASITTGIICCYTIAVHILLITEYTIFILTQHH